MIPLLIVLLTTPVDALLQRARCTAQHRIAALVERCTQLHAPDFKPAAPALQSDRARVGWTSTSLSIDAFLEGIDTDVLADTLGAPILIDGWLRYPLAIDAPGGRCAISALPSGAARTIRFAMTLGRGVRPVVDARCPTSVDLGLLVVACEEVWSGELDSADLIGERLPSSPMPGVRFERRPFGVLARFKGRQIRPEQVDAIYGLGEGRRHRRVYMHPPPFTATGRRCQADARFTNGHLTTLELWRAPAWRGGPVEGATLPLPAQRALEAIESACQQGPPTEVHRAFDSGSIRFAHLLQRYGAGEMVRRPRNAEDYVAWDARYTFSISAKSGRRCVLEADVMDPIRSVQHVRLRWSVMPRSGAEVPHRP